MNFNINLIVNLQDKLINDFYISLPCVFSFAFLKLSITFATNVVFYSISTTKVVCLYFNINTNTIYL